jgi:hypothetical protein
MHDLPAARERRRDMTDTTKRPWVITHGRGRASLQHEPFDTYVLKQAQADQVGLVLTFTRQT